ncbi:DeoR family transcriptional regulator [Streptomyces sp. IBSNAI002]|uniref:DeoR family transcriptional regulator n=1 Tax=Streptomyces sp. IBSNAI002 TaxID=3457500 RepID=UPI003FD34B81
MRHGHGQISLATGKLTAEARRDRIEVKALVRGYVTCRALALEFDVSAMTVNRDLQLLAGQGRLYRVRGGAVAPPLTLNEYARGLDRTAVDGRSARGE